MSKSRFDPSRETVGKIYRDAQLAHDGYAIEVGDMSREHMKGFVDDVNENLVKDPYDGKPFYLLITEKKDLQMKSAIVRIPYFFPHTQRPWPEDNTTVFWKNPKTQELRFCWSLPHWSEMDNILQNQDMFEEEMVRQIIAWKLFDMEAFGFYNDPHLKWIPKPKQKDRRLESNARSSSSTLASVS